jgi:hypothetical protein
MTDVDRIVKETVERFPGLAPMAVRDIVETTVETVRADLLLQFEKFQANLSIVAAPVTAPARKAKNGVPKKAKETSQDGEKKRKPLSREAKANLAKNLVKARAAKAKKVKQESSANEARSAAMKARWAEKKKAEKKSVKKDAKKTKK